MNGNNDNAGGGVWIALGAIGGSVAGLYAGQPSLGLLAGLAVGGAIAALMWVRSRR